MAMRITLGLLRSSDSIYLLYTCRPREMMVLTTTSYAFSLSPPTTIHFTTAR